MRCDSSAASTKDLGSARVRTDDRNGFSLVKRQEAVVVFQQDNRFTRGFTNDEAMLGPIFSTFRLKLRIIKRTSLFQYAQQPAYLVIQLFHAEGAAIQRFL